MKRIFALLLAVFMAAYPVFAFEEVTNDDGFDSELSDVSVAGDTPEEGAVSAPEDVPLPPVEEVPAPDDAAVPADDTAVLDDADSVSDAEPGDDLDGDSVEDGSPDASSPLPVTVVDADPVFQAVPVAEYAAELDIVDVPPDNPPFYGSCYVTGTTSSGSTVTLYFPVNYKSGYWGVDSNGYLFNVSSTSISGYYAGVYNNSVSASGFAYPRYRVNSSSSYDYQTLYLKPTASNMDIATGTAPRMTISQLLPYVSILFLGVILLCCMKRS